jgi:ATP-dependent Clp protease ATP-binding subunit ClpC
MVNDKYSFFGLEDKYLSDELKLTLDYVIVKLRDEINFNILNSELFIIGVLEQKINNTYFQLKSNDFNISKIIIDIRDLYYNKNSGVGYKRLNTIKINPDFKNIIEKAIIINQENVNKFEEDSINSHKLNTFHLFYSILLNGDKSIENIFNNHGISSELIYDIFFGNNDDYETINFDDMYKNGFVDEFVDVGNKNKKESMTEFGVILNQTLLKDKNIIVGRDREIMNIFSVLCRKNKNNVILCGETGVGKQSVVHKLVKLINEGLTPNKLKNKKIYKLDIAKVISGTRLRGEFEERFINILEEIKSTKNTLLYINDIQTLIGAGNSSGGLDAMDILKPYLTNNDIQIIGTITYDSFRVKIEKDTSLSRKFQRLDVLEPNTDECFEIIKGVKGDYEKYHNMVIPDDVILKTITLSKRYVTDKCLPDSALEIIDTTGSRINTNISIKEVDKIQKHKLEKEHTDALLTQDFDKVKVLKNQLRYIKKITNKKTILSEEDIKKTISEITNIPISNITDKENVKLLKMESELNKKVIGQQVAINKITNAIVRGRVGIKKSNGCVATIFLIGESGVGKTHLAKQIAFELFGSEDNMIRVDMSEYMESNSISKLIGSPPGYVGYEYGGQVTEKIKNKKYCVILWDEIEKAHNSIFNLLLQLFDEGHITDSLGNKIDCKNTINIITSNVGTKQANEFGRTVGFNNQKELPNKKNIILEKELKKKFPIEFLNRIDDIVYFNNLTEDDLKKIIRIELNKINEIIKESEWGVLINYDETLTTHIYNELEKVKEFGARPIKRLIEKEIATALSFKLLNGKYDKGTIFNVKVEDKQVIFS